MGFVSQVSLFPYWTPIPPGILACTSWTRPLI